jgi:hypothetical protein
MAERLVWGVAGNTIELHGEPEAMLGLAGWAAAFAVQAPAAFDLAIHSRLEALPDYEVALGVSFNGDTAYYRSPTMRGYADFGARRGELASDGAECYSGANYFMRVVLSGLALRRDALLFHGAGVLEAGRAWVFFGPGGAGKTTVARLSAPRPVLNDDLLVLSLDDGGWHAHATPFMSTSGLRAIAPADAPLANLCYLVQAKQAMMHPLSQISAMAHLLECVPFVTSSPCLAGRAMELCHDLARRVPCCALHFCPDPSFWEVLHNGFDDFR